VVQEMVWSGWICMGDCVDRAYNIPAYRPVDRSAGAIRNPTIHPTQVHPAMEDRFSMLVNSWTLLSLWKSHRKWLYLVKYDVINLFTMNLYR